MNKYAKAIVGAIGIGEMLGFPVVANSGFDMNSTIQAVIGAATVFSIWFVKNEPLIKQAVNAGKELVEDEQWRFAPAKGVAPAFFTSAKPMSTSEANAVKDSLAKVNVAANPLLEAALSAAPLTAAERTAVADAWAKVNAADPKPTA